jgi:hypothetical protein
MTTHILIQCTATSTLLTGSNDAVTEIQYISVPYYTTNHLLARIEPFIPGFQTFGLLCARKPEHLGLNTVITRTLEK